MKQPWTPSFETCARWRAFEGGPRSDRAGLAAGLGTPKNQAEEPTPNRVPTGNPLSGTGGGGAVTLTLTLMDGQTFLSFPPALLCSEESKAGIVCFASPAPFFVF